MQNINMQSLFVNAYHFMLLKTYYINAFYKLSKVFTYYLTATVATVSPININIQVTNVQIYAFLYPIHINYLYEQIKK